MRLPLIIPICLLSLLYSVNIVGQAYDATTIQQIVAKESRLSPSNYQINSSHISSTSGVTHIYFTQTIGELPIVNSKSAIHIAPNGSVVKYENRFIRPENYKKNDNKNLKRGPSDILLNVLEQLNIRKPKEFKINKSSAQSFEITAPSISKSLIKGDLKWYTHKDEISPVWQIEIQETANTNWWEIIADANSGEILEQTNYTISCDWNSDIEHTDDSHNSSPTQPNKNQSKSNEQSDYLVLPFPLESPNDGDFATVSNPSDSEASPLGWHDINGQVGPESYYTRGNNVWANEDLTGLNGRGYSPHGGSALSFDATFNLQNEPNKYLDGAITNLFYWNNIIHDITYQYGFTEEAGNFQDNNYSKSGMPKDFVVADAQDFGNCNANFSTPADGRSPIMQMYTCNNVTPSRDSDLDNGVIIHEYAHGISNRLIGGAANTSCLNNSEQMGEGWSDFYAVVLTMKSSDTAADPRPMGNYFTGQSKNGPGIRPFPYSTDTSVNPMTYSDLPSLAVPHGVGSLWTTMLWDLNWALIDAYGYDSDLYNGTGGNNIALLLVTEGLKLTDCSPGFVSGRDAILAADSLIFEGANSCIIWETFANRGLGINADQGDTDSVLDGVANFDMPLNCIRQDSFIVSSPERVQIGCDQTSFKLDILPYKGYDSDVSLSVMGLPEGVTGTFAQTSLAPSQSTVLTLSNTQSVKAGTFSLSVLASSVDSDHMIDLVWQKPKNISSPIISAPSNGAELYVARPNMTWDNVSQATAYEIQIATDIQFDNIISSESQLLSPEYYPEVLVANQLYYWRVRAYNPCEIGTYSEVNTFTISSCGAVFSDNGGSLYDHNNMERINYTICPDIPSSIIAIDFSEFDLEEVNKSRCWDWIVVYDGPDTSLPPMGEYCNEGLTNAPGEGFIQSSDPTGCLTFEFFSDPFITEAGWIADIICVPSDCNPSASISGIDILCPNTNNVDYQITSLLEPSDYQWSYSGSDVTINNNGFQDISIDFGPNATGGVLSCTLTLDCGDYTYEGLSIMVSENADCNEHYCEQYAEMITNTVLAGASDPDIFHSMGYLQSNGSIENSKQIVFKAEESVDLLSGFEIKAGSTLEVMIESCPN